MIPFSSFKLDNGLQVIVHEDHSVDIAVVNILYDVGSRDEQSTRTGFAHLFEHLMFGGSKNIPNYDEPLQRVGGENNAFTSTDITNYYLTVASANLETAFWLESDRMLSLSFDPEVLEVQRGVVIEEFKQRYLSQPYGDVWLKLRPLAYKVHPYQWATIGKEISHIEKATLEDVKEFFYQHYLPSNAVLVVAGKVSLNQVKDLAEKWFAPIESKVKPVRAILPEPKQFEKRSITVEAPVPANAIYKTYHMPGRFHKDFYAVDLLNDILSHGQSSRLFHRLVKQREMFTSISAHGMGSIDPGLVIISGRISNKVSFEDAEHAVDEVLDEIIRDGVKEDEVAKVKNQAESTLEFDEVEVMNRAMNLAFASLSGDINLVNQEAEKIRSVTSSDIKRVAGEILRQENSSVMYYRSTMLKK